MIKDKEWLEENVRENASHYPTYHDERDDLVKKMVDMHGVLKLIDQLDEPEITEEQAWRAIAEKHNQNEDYWEDAKIHYLNKLRLPVVQKFLAEWFEENQFRLDNAIYWLCVDNQFIIENESIVDGLTGIRKWFYEGNDCVETLIKMKDGYTIEQPKLLTVIVKDYDKTIKTIKLSEDEVNKMMEGLE